MRTERDRIVLVEDEQAIAEALCVRLEGEGKRVRHASTVAGALETLRAQAPDLVILDLFLPDGDGIEVLRRMRAEAALRDVPVLVMTGSRTRTADAADGFADGANAYIPKPFEVDRLVEAVERLLDETRAARGEGSPVVRAVGPVLDRRGAERIARVVEWRVADGARRVALDLGTVERVESTAIPPLAAAIRRSRAEGVVWSIEGLRPAARRTLEALGALRLFEEDEDVVK